MIYILTKSPLTLFAKGGIEGDFSRGTKNYIWIIYKYNQPVNYYCE